MRRILTAAVLSLMLCGCAGVITSLTHATPEQAKTVAEATQITTASEKLIDVYVNSGAASHAVLDELNDLVPRVHNTLKAAQAAQKAGNSALVATSLAAFNQAISALSAYEANAGVK